MSTPPANPAKKSSAREKRGAAPDALVDAAAAPKKRRGIQSIEIGFEILDVLVKAGGPIPLRTIAETSGVPVANVHNYLVSVHNVGGVVEEADTSFYGLGPYALKLGLSALQQFDVHKVARPAMAELGAQTGFTVFLGVWGNKGPTIVYRVESAQRPSLMELRMGSVLPLLTSALGRNFLAHLPRHVTASMVRDELHHQKRHPEVQYPADFPRSMAEVDAIVSRIHERGISCCKDLFLPGYTTLSAPVFDQLGHIIAGITLMGPNEELDDAPETDTERLLKHCSSQISSAAGWHG